MTFFSFIYYLWGLLIAFGFANTISLGKKFAKSREYKPINYDKKISNLNSLGINLLIWSSIGLLSVQWLWFLIILLFLFISKFLNNKMNWLEDPKFYKVFYHQIFRLVLMLMVLFPVLNHFHLHIPISQLILDKINNFF